NLIAAVIPSTMRNQKNKQPKQNRAPPPTTTTNGKRQHRHAKSNDGHPSPDPPPNSHGAMHGRRRIRGVRKRNEQFQLVKSCAREVADCSLRSALPHPPSRQESPPTGRLHQLKGKAFFWTSRPPWLIPA